MVWSPGKTVASTSAVILTAPWTSAAWAPNTYQAASSASKEPRSESRTSANGEDMRRPIQELLKSNLSAQVGRRVTRAGKISACTPSVLEQGVTSFDRRAWPFGAKALHPVIPIGSGHFGPIPLGVLSDVLILHSLHSNTEFTSRLRSNTSL